MNEPVTIDLTPGDRQSLLWRKLMDYCEQRLALHRRTNDGNLSHEDTQKLRGRIAELKHFIDLNKDRTLKPPISGASES